MRICIVYVHVTRYFEVRAQGRRRVVHTLERFQTLTQNNTPLQEETPEEVPDALVLDADDIRYTHSMFQLHLREIAAGRLSPARASDKKRFIS